MILRLISFSRLISLGVFALAVFLLSGCDFDLNDAKRGLAAAGSRSEPYEEWTGDPIALATVKSIAVLPFANKSQQRGFDAMVFSTSLASQLTSRGRLRVVYPAEVMNMVKLDQQKVWRHNAEYRRREALGIPLAEERADQLKRAMAHDEESVAGLEDRLLQAKDPVHNLNDAVTIGRLLNVDAVLMGTVTDFDPYMRPRLSLNMTLVTTGTSDPATHAMAQLTQWGIPRAASVARGRVWFRQQNFDTRQGNVGLGAYTHGLRHHTDHTPYDTQTYIRSVSNYFDYVGSVLSTALLDAKRESAKEAEDRAVARASEMNMTRQAARMRIQALVEPDGPLPSGDGVVNQNLGDRRDRTWRPDVYSRTNPGKDPMRQFMPPPAESKANSTQSSPPPNQ